jgi:chemotaxis protein histidine kinase CheA
MIQMIASGYLFSDTPEQPLQLDIEKDVFSDYCDGIEKAVGCNPKDKLKEFYCQLQLSTMFEGEDCLVIPREFPFQLLFGAFDPMAAMEEAKKDNESVVIRPNYEIRSSDDEEVSYEDEEEGEENEEVDEEGEENEENEEHGEEENNAEEMVDQEENNAEEVVDQLQGSKVSDDKEENEEHDEEENKEHDEEKSSEEEFLADSEDEMTDDLQRDDPQRSENEEEARLARLEAIWKLKHHPLKHYFVRLLYKDPRTKEGRVAFPKMLFANEGKTNKNETMANAADLKVFDPQIKKGYLVQGGYCENRSMSLAHKLDLQVSVL